MKKRTIVLLSLFLLVASASNGIINKWQNSHLSINAQAPPALVYVTNSNGDRTGANPALPLNANGQQAGSQFGLNEIPNSLSQQDNIAVGSIDAGTLATNAHTMWKLDIFDSGKQTYTINALGVAAGTQLITVIGIIKEGGSSIHHFDTTVQVLVSPGQTRQVSLTFDPVSGTLATQPVIGNGDLLTDIKSACAQALIEKWACVFLKDKAERIQKALDEKRYGEARDLVQSFLYNLGELGGHGDNDRDCHTAIQEPALAIIKADAKALLTQLDKGEYHNRQH